MIGEGEGEGEGEGLTVGLMKHRARATLVAFEVTRSEIAIRRVGANVMMARSATSATLMCDVVRVSTVRTT